LDRGSTILHGQKKHTCWPSKLGKKISSSKNNLMDSIAEELGGLGDLMTACLVSGNGKSRRAKTSLSSFTIGTTDSRTMPVAKRRSLSFGSLITDGTTESTRKSNSLFANTISRHSPEFLDATPHLYERSCPSVRMSVLLSVCPFDPPSYF